MEHFSYISMGVTYMGICVSKYSKESLLGFWIAKWLQVNTSLRQLYH